MQEVEHANEGQSLATEKPEMKTQTKAAGPGRPRGKKVNWGLLTGNDWRYKGNREIAEMLGTSVPNVFGKRKKLMAKGMAKYTGKAIKRGPKPKAKAKA